MLKTKTSYFPLFLVTIITCFVYLNSLNNGFVYDDNFIIVENDYLKNLSNIPVFFGAKLTSSFIPQGMYRPLTMLTYALNFWSAGLNSLYYHLVSLLLHIFNICLIYLILNYLWKDLEPLAVLFALSIFALHPINSQAVNFLSCRATLLFTLFYLVSFYLYLKGKFWLTLLAFGLGLLSKEEMISLPLFLAVYEWGCGGKRDFKKILPFVVLALSYLLWRRYMFGTPALIYRFRPVSQDISLALFSLPFYFRLILWPVGLSVEHTAILLFRIGALNFIYIVGFYLILTFLIIRLFRKNRIEGFCLIWPAITVSPFLFASFTNPAAEHRFYLGSIGMALLCGYLLDSLLRRCHSYAPARWEGCKTAVIGVALCCILGLSLLTIDRNGVWKDELSLWRDAAKTAPFSDRVHNNLGREYLERKQYALAEKELNVSISLNPSNAQAHYNLGLFYAYSNRLDAAVNEFENTIRILPGFAAAYNNLAVAYLSYEPPKLDLGRKAASAALKLGYPVDGYILKRLEIESR